MTRTARAAITLALMLPLAASCTMKEPFVRANPYDPDGIYMMSLTGPDSAHAIGERFAVVLATEPALPSGDLIVHWEAYPAGDCLPDGVPTCSPVPSIVLTTAANGEFVVNTSASAKYLAVSVSVSFGDVVTGHQIMVGQKVMSLELSCSPWSLPEDPCLTPIARDSIQLIHPRMRDGAGAAVRRQHYATLRGQVTSRDPNVAGVLPQLYHAQGAARVIGVSPGTTWVVMRADEGIDSVRVTVVP
jgi:hypothetical protein